MARVIEVSNHENVESFYVWDILVVAKIASCFLTFHNKSKSIFAAVVGVTTQNIGIVQMPIFSGLSKPRATNKSATIPAMLISTIMSHKTFFDKSGNFVNILIPFMVEQKLANNHR